MTSPRQFQTPQSKAHMAKVLIQISLNNFSKKKEKNSQKSIETIKNYSFLQPRSKR